MLVEGLCCSLESLFKSADTRLEGAESYNDILKRRLVLFAQRWQGQLLGALVGGEPFHAFLGQTLEHEEEEPVVLLFGLSSILRMALVEQEARNLPRNLMRLWRADTPFEPQDEVQQPPFVAPRDALAER